MLPSSKKPFPPFETKARTYHERGGAGQRTAGRRGGGADRAGQDGTPTGRCAQENLPPCRTEHRRQLF